MEEMDYNILFRWFVGLNWDDAVWDATCTAGRSAARQNNLKSPQGPKKTRTEMACSHMIFQQPAGILVFDVKR